MEGKLLRGRMRMVRNEIPRGSDGLFHVMQDQVVLWQTCGCTALSHFRHHNTTKPYNGDHNQILILS